jgi:hypothetical protein
VKTLRQLVNAKGRDSAAVIVWASICLTALRVSLEAANRLVLWRVYGSTVVARQHLSMVRIKPVLMVSNGDILRGWGFIHFLFGISLWIPVSVGVLIVVFKYATPQWWREQRESGGKTSPGAVGIVATLVMFVCIPGKLGFVPAMALGLSAAILGLSWLHSRIASHPVRDPE